MFVLVVAVRPLPLLLGHGLSTELVVDIQVFGALDDQVVELGSVHEGDFRNTQSLTRRLRFSTAPADFRLRPWP